MKKISLILAMTAMVFLASCGGDSKPENVAKKFAQVFFQGNFEEAKKYCTSESAKMIDFVVLMTTEEDLKELKESKVTIEIGEVTISEDGNSATVEVTAINPNEDDEIEEDLKLVKEDGTWKVDAGQLK